MSLVILTSTQYRDSATAPTLAQDPGHFVTNFQEPLELFPGQTVEFLSLRFRRKTVAQVLYPQLIVNIPELQTRMFNSSRQNVSAGVAYIPTTGGYTVNTKQVADAYKPTVPTPCMSTN